MTKDGKKTGGRTKGTPNKDTQELIEIAERLGCSFFEVICLFAMGDWKALGYKSEMTLVSSTDKGESYKYTIDPAVRAKCAMEGASYLYAKRKAIELSNSPENPLEMRVALSQEDRKELVKIARSNKGK